MTELNITTRESDVKASALREAGKMPAVFYGPKEENTPIVVDAAEFTRVWGEAGGSTIVDLKGVGDDKEVLIHDVDWDPVKETPLHADFYCIERGKTLTVTVPLTFVGEAPAEKEGGIVVKVMHELEIDVKPRDIPHDIQVDLAVLTGLESTITVADLNLPDTIQPTAEQAETVVSITQAQEEVEEEARDISDVQIEEKGKGDDESEGDSE